MTVFQRQILKALEALGGSATSAEIAKHMNKQPQSIGVGLQWMRGAGLVTDGSTSRPIAGGIAWSRPKGPIRWTLTTT